MLIESDQVVVVAKRLRHWTRDLWVWGSIPQCWSCIKALNIASGLPASVGTWCMIQGWIGSAAAFRTKLARGKVKSDKYCIDIWMLNRYFCPLARVVPSSV